MKAILFKTLWGHDGTLPEAIALAKEAGFGGIEAAVPLDEDASRDFFTDLEKGNLPWIAEVSTCTPPGIFVPEPRKSARHHLISLEDGIIRSLPGNPLFINTMGGYDAWDFDEAMAFHSGVLDLEQEHGIAVSVETHRGRYSYNPWLFRDIMKRLPGLKITCDFSHWCVVTERLILDEEPEILHLAAQHAHHIQPRVGYAQGAQVPDPRAPEYLYALEAHERWWDRVWESMAERGFQTVTMTPEFGPDGYLQAAPFTQVPVANLWEVNRWIGHRLKERLGKISNHKTKLR
jgi:sugar phosphate isomerase/epimerase